MLFYHRTSAVDAAAILREGFRDGRGRFLMDLEFTGVWLSTEPLDEDPNPHRLTLLQIEIPEEQIAPFEWIEEGKTCREFLVPAAFVNHFGPPVRLSE